MLGWRGLSFRVRIRASSTRFATLESYWTRNKTERINIQLGLTHACNLQKMTLNKWLGALLPQSCPKGGGALEVYDAVCNLVTINATTRQASAAMLTLFDQICRCALDDDETGVATLSAIIIRIAGEGSLPVH